MPQPKGIPVAPLTGLLDMRSLPDLLPQGALRFRQNFNTVGEGKLERGVGWTKALTQDGYNNQDFHDQLLLFGGTVREPVTGLWEFQSARGIRSLWLATQSRIAKLNETTGNWKIIASGLGGGAGTDCSGPRFKAANVGDYVIFTNNHDRPKIHRLEQPPFDSVLIADIPDLEVIGLSKAAKVFTWKDIVIFADVEMDGERKGNMFVWGNVKDPPSFDPAKPESIAGRNSLNYGERILAGGETTAGTFLMYTTHGIWELSVVNDDRVFVTREAYPGRKADFVGCLKYENTLVDIGGDHIYMAKDGMYAFNPYRSQPELVLWLHRASSVLYDDIDEAACAAHIGWFHDGEAFWSVKRTSDIGCPGVTLRVETTFKVADTIDHGFTAAANFRPQPIPTIRDFILDKRICDLAGLTDSLDDIDLPPPFENEGLPAPFDEPTAAFTPTVIHTHSIYQFGGTVTVSGAGTSPANGTYTWNYSTNRYESAIGWYITTTTDGAQRQWMLYNDLDVLAYTNTGALGTIEGTWTESNGGMDPPPDVVAGEDVIVSEDFEQIESDEDSLCALMGDTTIDDLCQGCETNSELIVASSQDWCLKEFNEFYRERCANFTATGSSGDDGYTSAVGAYILDGYDSIIRFAPLFQEGHMVIVEGFGMKGIPGVQSDPSSVSLRVGVSGQTADPNDGRCPIVWLQLSDKLLKCVTDRTEAQHVAARTQPSQDISWRFERKGKNLFLELKISGVGGDCILSGVVASAKSTPARNF